ncbi:hypothetical protein [Ferrimonas marina]|uniref:Uncharacterized protein n=1 Tax=Ferrimonas marina TaxID=299255 RepID=A0A1M5U145_9GAMM|nr:hypothetical protein [Ferrimonas marina]SHH56674.1 hypothetical protein SAMN02745129_2361 [Ferrimonas marina]
MDNVEKLATLINSKTQLDGAIGDQAAKTLASVVASNDIGLLNQLIGTVAGEGLTLEGVLVELRNQWKQQEGAGNGDV